MINFTFFEQDLKSIAYERFHHPVPRVQRRKEVLWLNPTTNKEFMFCVAKT